MSYSFLSYIGKNVVKSFQPILGHNLEMEEQVYSNHYITFACGTYRNVFKKKKNNSTTYYLNCKGKTEKISVLYYLAKMKFDYPPKGQQFTYSVLILILQFNNMGASFDYVIRVNVYFV